MIKSRINNRFEILKMENSNSVLLNLLSMTFAKERLLSLVDDEDRENEGDMIFAAEKATPELVNFLIKNAGGLICVPMAEKRLKELGIEMMTSFNTAFARKQLSR